MTINRTLTLAAVAAIILVIGSLSAQAQIRYRVAGGLSTAWIINDNPATDRIVPATDSLEYFGGGFDGMQVGFGIRFWADLDKQKTFRVPIGIDYYNFEGAQTQTSSTNSIAIRHNMDVIATTIGFEAALIEFPFAFARMYAGIEARPTFFSASNVDVRLVTKSTDTTIVVEQSYSNKESQFRLGALGRLGIEGELIYPVFVNTSVGVGALNLIGRDTTPVSEGGNGELMTPGKLDEIDEGMLLYVNVTFMIQVRL